MLYEETYKEYQKYKPHFFDDEFKRLKNEHLFQFIQKRGDELSKDRSRVHDLMIFAVHFYLTLITIFTYLKLLFLNKNKLKAQYLISSPTTSSAYDPRSKTVLKFLNPRETCNFIHCGDLRKAFINSVKVNNAVYFESILFMLLLFTNQSESSNALEFLNNKKNEIKKELALIEFIFKTLKIKSFICIDDSRNTSTFCFVCKKMGIKSIAYQHARFNKYHVGLETANFDKYLVWSNYFKDLLKTINNNYTDEKIIVCSHPSISFDSKTIQRNKNTVMFLEESNFKLGQALPLMKIFDSSIKIIYRKKPGLKQTDFEKVNNIIFSGENDLFTDLKFYKPSMIIGSESTVLLESWLLGIPSIAVKNKIDYAYHLFDHDLIECSESLEELDALVKKYLRLTEEELIDQKLKIWSGSKTPSVYMKYLN